MNPTLHRKPFDFGQLMAYILIVISFACLITCGQGCMTIEKAKMKVLTNKEAFDTVGRLFVELNPCVKDSVVVFTQGENLVLIDSVQVYIPGDTINTLRVDTLVTFITKNTTRVDTFRASIKDLQEFKLLTKSLDEAMIENSILKGRNYEQANQILESKKETLKWKNKAIFPWVFFILGIAVYAFIRFKIPLPKF